MARGVSLVMLVVSLAIGGWLLSAQTGGSTSIGTAGQEIDAARRAAAGLTLQQAQAELEQLHALHGTYAGAAVAGFGVTLVRADASSYCLQTGTGAQTSHLAGPGGAPEPGPC